ncbi:phage major capsid protein [Kitasatospora mediocidica]|uniref:phage major capsid protein n=1 Tax=Kitasatospora mediocidica TaxID=58352 RepID=UPI000AA5F3EF|nr:phage major capsid protein [Kitasatospora mediocidica]
MRPGRVTANLCVQGAIPPGTDSLNIPKIASGTATAPQGTQNTGIQQTDITTTSIAASVNTVAGGQTISMQLVEQSPLNIDDIILEDLAADYAQKLDAGQVLGGTGTGGTAMGLLNLAGTIPVTWTQATPALGGAGGLYSKVANAIQLINTSRFQTPTAIVMHPRRWWWAVAQSDAQGRPLVVPNAGHPMNNLGTMDSIDAEGPVGSMLGLPVYVDANMPTNLGTGTNQDAILIGRFRDFYLWEGDIKAEAFQQTYAQNLSLFVRLYNYVAFQGARYLSSTAIITGTGAVTPAF